MISRAAGAVCVLLLGGMPALAQFFPMPAPQRPQPPADVDDDDSPTYDPRYGRVPPPGSYGSPRGNDPSYGVPSGQQYGRGGYPQDVESSPLPPPGGGGGGYREPGGYREAPVPGYEPIDPRNRVARPNYGEPVPGYEPIDPRDRVARPNYGEPVPGYEPVDPRSAGRPGYGEPVDPRSAGRPGYGEPVPLD